MSVSFDGLGLLTIDFRVGSWELALHLGVEREHRLWGYQESWWDGPMPMLGAGWFFLLIGMQP